MYRRVDKLANNLLTFGRSHTTGRPFFIFTNMEIKKVLVDKAYAEQLLTGNINNRSVKSDCVKRYAIDMAKGNWKEDTGELIKISDTNRLLDGQHRLMAIIESGVSINLHICYGLSDSVFDVIDTGKGRSGGDALQIIGAKNATNLAAMIQVFNRLTSGKALIRGGAMTRKTTNKELVEMFLANKVKFEKAIIESERWHRAISKVMPMSEIGGFYLYLCTICEQTAYSFFNELCSGDKITNKTILLLRRRLIDNKVSKIHKLTPDVRMGLIIKTWNYFRRGVEVKLLQYFDGDEKQKPE